MKRHKKEHKQKFIEPNTPGTKRERMREPNRTGIENVKKRVRNPFFNAIQTPPPT
jgi:hypothetical protein